MRNFKSTLVGMCLAVSSLGLTAFSALTAPITIPTGLNPGDQYRIAFVTRTIRDVTSSNIADYNAFVTAAADAVTEPAAAWHVLRRRYRRLAWLSIDGNGQNLVTVVWTGTSDFSGQPVDDFGLGGGDPEEGELITVVGNSGFASFGWAENSSFDNATTELHPLYAISGILIVADTSIPEPGALAVLGLGLLGIGFV